MANRALAVIPTALSILVSYQSAIAILGVTAEIYAYGFQFMIWANVVTVISMSLASLIFVPWLYPLQLSSVNEYFYMRFNSKLLTSIAAFLSLTNGVMYTGVAMFAPSAAFESVTGFPITISVPLMAVVCIAYTSLGGMRAVIWTDVFQFFVMMGGLLAILIKGMMTVGGYSEAFSLLYQQDRMNYIIVTPDPRVRHTVYEFLIGLNINWICLYGLSQAVVQRYCATTSLTKARLSILLNIPANGCLSFLLGSVAITVIAYFINIGCDPLANREISNPNLLLPFFVTKFFSDSYGFSGLFLATLYGGALSTVSSTLSGGAANCWKDILNWKFNYLQETRKALLTRFLVIAFGALATGVAFLASTVPGPIMQVMSLLSGSITGPYLGLFILGGISRKVNLKGSLVGAACGLMIGTWLSVGSILTKNKHPPLHPLPTTGCFRDIFNMSTPTIQNSTLEYSFGQESTTEPATAPPQLQGIQNFYAISYLWFTTIGLLTTVLTGFLASLIFRDKKNEEDFDQRLLIPWNKILTFRESNQVSTLSNGQVKDLRNKTIDSVISLDSLDKNPAK